MRRRLGLAWGVAVLAAGCAAGPAYDATPAAPSTGQLRARAGLAACPTTSAAAPRADGLPDVTLPCLGAGPPVHLAGLRGAPTLVNVWGSWCEPCQRETPLLQQTYAALHGRLRMLGVDTADDPRSALDFAAHVGMRYPSVVDDDKRVLLRYAVGPPVTLFVAPDGRVVHVQRGEYRSEAALRSAVARYLGVGS